MERSPHAAAAVLTLLLATSVPIRAQEAPPAAWARNAVHADLVLGGSLALQARVHFSPTLRTSGDPETNREFFERWTRRFDDEAARSLERRATPQLWEEVRPFYASAAGHALRRAEAAALVSASDLTQFGAMAAQHFGDPEHVGANALQQMAELQQAAGENPIDPLVAARLLGASTLLADDARAIGTFFHSEVGVRWQEVRAAAWAEASARLLACVLDGEQRGVLRDLATLPRYLPRGEGTASNGEDAAKATDRLVVEVVCFEPGELTEVRNPTTGAIEKVARGDAKGRVVGWRLGGVECRDEAALRKALRAELDARAARRAARPGDEAQAPSADVVPKPGTFYADVARTSAVLKGLGITDVQFRFPGEAAEKPPARSAK